MKTVSSAQPEAENRRVAHESNDCAFPFALAAAPCAAAWSLVGWPSRAGRGALRRGMVTSCLAFARASLTEVGRELGVGVAGRVALGPGCFVVADYSQYGLRQGDDRSEDQAEDSEVAHFLCPFVCFRACCAFVSVFSVGCFALLSRFLRVLYQLAGTVTLQSRHALIKGVLGRVEGPFRVE